MQTKEKKEMTREEHKEYIDRIRKIITIYHSDGKEHAICPLCGIDFEELYKFIAELKTQSEVDTLILEAKREVLNDIKNYVEAESGKSGRKEILRFISNLLKEGEIEKVEKK